MREVGFIDLATLAKLERSGSSPKEAVDRLLAEAERRNPDALAVVMEKRDGGFSIIAT